MAEFTRIINGRPYRYLSYWDKKAKKSVLMYLGRVNEKGELIVPSGNVPLQNINDVIDLAERFDMSRKEAWDIILPELQKKQELNRKRRQERLSLRCRLKPWLEFIALIIGIIALFYSGNWLFDYLVK